MIRSIYQSGDGQVHTGLLPSEFPAALADEAGLLLVVLENEPTDVCEPILHDIFGFHPLAVDDALQESHVPKIDDWGTYLYVVLHGALFDPKAMHLDTAELDIFLGKNYVVTHQVEPIAAIDRIWMACRRGERMTQRGAMHLAYVLIDELVADYMPVLDEIGDEIDRIESVIFSRPQPSVLEEILALKRALLNLRRILTPQREVLNLLARGHHEIFAGEEHVFFRDIYDHLVRMYDLSESLRDLVGGVLDIYLSVVNNRMNDAMKTLAVIATLFMPISFIAGFFGMNFFQPAVPLPEWTGSVMFALTLLMMIGLPVGMALWIRKRGWM